MRCTRIRAPTPASDVDSQHALCVLIKDCCMDSRDMTGEGCNWSSAPAAAGQGSTAPADADVQITYECTQSLTNEPYKPLNYQIQQLQQMYASADEQQHRGFGTYRPLDCAAQSQPAPYQPLTQNTNHHQQQQQLQYAQHTSSSNNGSSAHSGSVGCQPAVLHNSSSTGSLGLWQQQQQQQYNGCPGAAPSATQGQQQQQQQQWNTRTHQQPPASYGRNTFNTGYNNTYNNGSGSRVYGGRSYHNGGSWSHMRTGSAAGFNSSSGGYNNRYNSGYGRGGGNTHGRPGGLGSRSPSPRPQSGPLPWVKQGCWLIPRSGSSNSIAAAAGAAAASGQRTSADAATGSSNEVGGRMVIIMRGLPGAGKSTRAGQLAATAAPNSGDAAAAAEGGVCKFAIHSTDSYFMDASGKYVFNVDMLSTNHQKNYDAFCASIAAGIDTIIVDNTNIQPWQFEKYVLAAWQAGYRVREEVVGEFTAAAAMQYAARNTHGVPLDKIMMMLDQWQP